MAKPKECGNCNKPATIHLTQIINNEIKKLDFCENCPFQKNLHDSEGFSLAELLAQNPLPFGNAGGIAAAQVQPSCSSCGFTPSQFKKHHRFGCPDCYEELSGFVKPMIANMQSGSTHSGKIPALLQSTVYRSRQLESLEARLKEAVAQERYEEAAQLRDDISKIRSESN